MERGILAKICSDIGKGIPNLEEESTVSEK